MLNFHINSISSWNSNAKPITDSLDLHVCEILPKICCISATKIPCFCTQTGSLFIAKFMREGGKLYCFPKYSFFKIFTLERVCMWDESSSVFFFLLRIYFSLILKCITSESIIFYKRKKIKNAIIDLNNFWNDFEILSWWDHWETVDSFPESIFLW